MDALEGFINEENIERFADKLYSEHSPEQQNKLRQLLIQEEYKFGLRSSLLEMAERHIRESAGRINNQKTIIGKLRADGHDTRAANRVLENFVALQAIFREFRASVLQALDRVEI